MNSDFINIDTGIEKINLFFKNSVTLLYGNSGVGKTYIFKNIVEIQQESNGLFYSDITIIDSNNFAVNNINSLVTETTKYIIFDDFDDIVRYPDFCKKVLKFIRQNIGKYYFLLVLHSNAISNVGFTIYNVARLKFDSKKTEFSLDYIFENGITDYFNSEEN